MLDPHALKIIIDGSALKNPGGPGGYAGIAVYPGDWNLPDEQIFAIGYTETTNNRMELRACIRAMEYVRDELPGPVDRVLVVTDSQYVYNNHRRVATWRKNKWSSFSGRPIENCDLWKQFISVHSKLRVRTEIKWHKGKATPRLKLVDRSAKAAAHQPWEADRGFRAGKIGRSAVRGGTASTLFAASGQDAIVHVYKTGQPRKHVQKVYFDLYSPQAADFVVKHHAYFLTASAIELHRGNCYCVRFNADPAYPMVEASWDAVAVPPCPHACLSRLAQALRLREWISF